MRRCRLAECRGACCLHGVWVDPLEKNDILANLESILPYMPESRRDPRAWFGEQRERDDFFPSGWVVATATVPNPAHYGGTECIFLRADWRCALQAASQAAGYHPWRWKPFHCIIHPITFEQGQFTIASDKELLAEEGGCFRQGEKILRMSDCLADEIAFLKSVGGRDSQVRENGVSDFAG
ncbi:MAG: DUF3109 family protein [Anaerolineales bacterium]|nr:DUF3109 family protein [Anaerolineales bacterium]